MISSFSRIASLTAVVLGLSGCAILPGQYASFSKTPVVLESKEEPDSLDYTLLKVTPLLVKQLNEELAATQFSIQGKLTPSKKPSYPYRLGPQDVVSISVWGYDEFSGASAAGGSGGGASGAANAGRLIDSMGNVFLPLIGNVKLAGLTVNEARGALRNAYARLVKDPQIEISVINFRSQKVFMAGEVGTPGVVPINDQPLTLVDALTQVGGLTDKADFYNVVLTRGNEKVRINADRLYFAGDMSINLLLQNGDVVSVPDALDRKIFVLGEVGSSAGINQARAYVMRRGQMSLTEVLSDAGGVNPFSAAGNQIYILRANPNVASPTQAARDLVVYLFEGRDPSSLVLADQFPVLPRDVVFVNPTGPTMIGRFIGQFLPVYSSASTIIENPY